MADFTITTSPVNTKTWLSQQNLYVCGYTRIRVQSTPAPGSSFSSYDVVVGGEHYTGADVTTSTWQANRADVQPYISVHATGSSGSVYKTANVTMLGYAKPILTTFNAERGTYTNGTWTSSPSGAHIRVEAVPTVSLSTQGNTATVTVKIGNTNPNATSGNYYYFTGTSASVSYTVTGTATDLLQESTTRTISVSSEEVPFNVDVDIPGAAFGKVAEKTKVVEVAPDWSLQANGKHNEFAYQPYSFRTNGGSATVGWARIARITATGTFVANVGVPKIVFTVQSRTLTKATLQIGFNGPTLLGNLDIDVTVNNWLCNPARTDNVPFVQTISTSATMGVYDVYFPKGYAEDDLTVYTQCSAELQGLITIEYSDNLLASKPGSNVNDFKLAPVPIMTVSNRMGFGSSANPNLYQVKLADSWSLVANGKNNQFAYMPYSWGTTGGGSVNGWARIAQINITGNNLSEPMEFRVFRRLDGRGVTLTLTFANADSTDPSVASFYYDSIEGTFTNNSFNAFVYKEATSTWGVYVKKSAPGDYIMVYTTLSRRSMDRCNIVYADALYDTNSVPSGAVMATPVPVLSSTPTLTKNSGNSTVSDTHFYRCGNMCWFSFLLTLTANVAVGSDPFGGTVSGIPMPLLTSATMDYTGTSMVTAYLTSNGAIGTRVWNGTAVNTAQFRFNFMYMTNS